MPDASTPLLEFLLLHEESFQSRARLASLYSDFSLQARSNPDGYEANVKAWCKALEDAGRAGVLPGRNLLSLQSGPELLHQLQLERWGMPAALGVVVRDALAQGTLIPHKEFMSRQQSIYSSTRITPWKVAGWVGTWAMQKVGLMASEGAGNEKLAAGSFVLVANVSVAARAVEEQLEKHILGSKAGAIFSRATVQATFGHCLGEASALTEQDFDVLLTYLSRDRQLCAYDSATGTVRFVPPSSSTPSKELGPITSDEVAVARLKTLLLTLEAEVPTLEAKVTTLDRAARDAVAAKQTGAARSALRSKKLVNETLDKRRDTLFQLQEVYSRIEAAHTNAEIVKVMEASAGALRSLNRQVGGAEGVQEVADALREEMDTADEVNAALGESAGPGEVNEDEVDEEFEALERAARDADEASKAQEQSRREMLEAEETRKRLAGLDKPVQAPGVGDKQVPEKAEVEKETTVAS